MNNIKKAVLAVLIACMAFGFSAFTTIKRNSLVVYYKVDRTKPLANNPAGYFYYSGDRCEAGGDVCSAQWYLGSTPVPIADGTPLPLTGVTFMTGTVVAGHFE